MTNYVDMSQFLLKVFMRTSFLLCGWKFQPQNTHEILWGELYKVKIAVHLIYAVIKIFRLKAMSEIKNLFALHNKEINKKKNDTENEMLAFIYTPL